MRVGGEVFLNPNIKILMEGVSRLQKSDVEK